MAIEGPKATAAAPRQGLDGQGGLSCPARNGRNAQGKKARRRHCGRGGRGAAGLRPDQAMEEASRCARSTVGDKEMMAISHAPCTKAAQPSPVLTSPFSGHCVCFELTGPTDGTLSSPAMRGFARNRAKLVTKHGHARAAGASPLAPLAVTICILNDMGNVAPLICSCLIGSCRSKARARGWTERMARLHWPA